MRRSVPSWAQGGTVARRRAQKGWGLRVGFPIHPPRRHIVLERGLEGRDHLLKLVKRHAREIQELHRAGLQRGEPWSRRTASMLPLDSGFPPSAPRTGQVAFTTSGGPIPAAYRIFAFSFPSR